MTALLPETMKEAFADSSLKGRLVESSIGSQLVRNSRMRGGEIYYWREQNEEIDFITEIGKSLTAIEVKSGKEKVDYRILERFRRAYPHCEFCLISNESNTTWESFLKT